MWNHKEALRHGRGGRRHSPGVEPAPVACTALPMAAVPRILFRLDVEVVDVVDQVLEGVEQQVTLQAKQSTGLFKTKL